jgi:hypothetical protein
MEQKSIKNEWNYVNIKQYVEQIKKGKRKDWNINKNKWNVIKMHKNDEI